MQRMYLLLAGILLSLGWLVDRTVAQESSLQSWNAAVNYWQAFGLMPEWTEKEKKLWEASPSLPDSVPGELSAELPASVKGLTERSGIALKALELANRVEKCDWQLDYSQGPMMLLPHLQVARELARQSNLRARYRFSQLDNAGGIADALATIRLGRAVGSDRILISLLVDNAIERGAINVLAAYLPQFNEAERKELLEGWQTLKASPTLAMTLETEKKVFGGWLVAELERVASGKKPEDSAADFLKPLFLMAGSQPERETKEAIEAMSRATIAKAREGVQQYLADCDELTRIAALEFKSRKQKLPEFEQALQKYRENKEFVGGHLSLLLLPAVDRAADAEEARSVRCKLMEAALKGMGSGETGIVTAARELGIEVDYIPLENGFELSSPLIEPGKVEKLKFGGGYRAVK